MSRNGDALRTAVIAAAQGHEPAFMAWLSEECRWANTLVDRIVSAPLEPAGAVAEPYALWAIERQPGLTLPFTHPAIVLTDDLAPFERLKLHILNLGHSWLAERWEAAGARAGATVREALSDPVTGAALDDVLAQEVIPGFATRGLEEEAKRYAATTIERFANPYLDHLLSDIHAHHAQKVGKRIGAFVCWVDEGAGRVPAMPQLRALAARYDG
ncbi:hypothetical protein [Sphingomonas sp. 8AM]|uniref:mannitol dehydrogenase family protein n=1 Tax=Sphingomonas sp. 8AM TaxID=2653170 RepID=UPI0012F04555